MVTASIAKLKMSLSQYLARVKAGEELIVTDRGRPVAKIVPLQGRETGIPPHLAELERAGIVKIGTGKLPEGFTTFIRPVDPEGSILQALLDEREEGR